MTIAAIGCTGNPRREVYIRGRVLARTEVCALAPPTTGGAGAGSHRRRWMTPPCAGDPQRLTSKPGCLYHIQGSSLLPVSARLVVKGPWVEIRFKSGQNPRMKE
jgi:hypothetical protein